MASTIDQIPGGTGGSGPTILDSGNVYLSSSIGTKIYTATSNCYINVCSTNDTYYNINNTGAKDTGIKVMDTGGTSVPSVIIYERDLTPRVFISGGYVMFSNNTSNHCPSISVLLTEGDYLSAFNLYNGTMVYYMAYIWFDLILHKTYILLCVLL